MSVEVRLRRYRDERRRVALGLEEWFSQVRDICSTMYCSLGG